MKKEKKLRTGRGKDHVTRKKNRVSTKKTPHRNSARPVD